MAAINSAWSWAVSDAEEVLAVNSMANVFLKDNVGRYWRVCPEELYAKMEAENEEEVATVFGSTEFKEDWQLLGLMNKAEAFFGKLEAGQCYALKKPAVLGGEYSVDNMFVADIKEYLTFTGEIAHQVKDLPDGTKVELHGNINS